MDVWGDQDREASLVTQMARYDVNAEGAVGCFRAAALLKTYGVTHVLSRIRSRERRCRSSAARKRLCLSRRRRRAGAVRARGAAREDRRRGREASHGSGFDPDGRFC